MSINLKGKVNITGQFKTDSIKIGEFEILTQNNNFLISGQQTNYIEIVPEGSTANSGGSSNPGGSNGSGGSIGSGGSSGSGCTCGSTATSSVVVDPFLSEYRTFKNNLSVNSNILSSGRLNRNFNKKTNKFRLDYDSTKSLTGADSSNVDIVVHNPAHALLANKLKNKDTVFKRVCVDEKHSNNIQDASNVVNPLNIQNAEKIMLMNGIQIPENFASTYRPIITNYFDKTILIGLSTEYVPFEKLSDKLSQDDYNQIVWQTYSAVGNPEGRLLGFGYFCELFAIDMTSNVLLSKTQLFSLSKSYFTNGSNVDPTWKFATASRGPLSLLSSNNSAIIEFAMTTQNPGGNGFGLFTFNVANKSFGVKSLNVLNPIEGDIPVGITPSTSDVVAQKVTWALKQDDPKGSITYKLPSTSLTNLKAVYEYEAGSTTVNRSVTPVVDSYGNARVHVVSSSSLAQYCTFDAMNAWLKMGVYDPKNETSWYNATGKLTLFVEELVGDKINLVPVRVFTTCPDNYSKDDLLSEHSFIKYPGETSHQPLRIYYPILENMKFEDFINDGSSDEGTVAKTSGLQQIVVSCKPLDPLRTRKETDERIYQSAYVLFFGMYKPMSSVSGPGSTAPVLNNEPDVRRFKLLPNNSYSSDRQDYIYSDLCFIDANQSDDESYKRTCTSYYVNGKTYTKDLVDGKFKNNGVEDNLPGAHRRKEIANYGFFERISNSQIVIPEMPTLYVIAPFDFVAGSTFEFSHTKKYLSEPMDISLLGATPSNVISALQGNRHVRVLDVQGVAALDLNTNPTEFRIEVDSVVLYGHPIIKEFDEKCIDKYQLDGIDANRLSLFGCGIYTESSLIYDSQGKPKYLGSGGSNGNYTPASDEFEPAVYAAKKVKELFEESNRMVAIVTFENMFKRVNNIGATSTVSYSLGKNLFKDWNTSVFLTDTTTNKKYLVGDFSVRGHKQFYSRYILNNTITNIEAKAIVDLYLLVMKLRALVRSNRGKRFMNGQAFLVDAATLELKHSIVGAFDDLENRDHEIIPDTASFTVHDDGRNRDETWGIATCGNQWYASGNKQSFRAFEASKVDGQKVVLVEKDANRKNFALINHGVYGIKLAANGDVELDENGLFGKYGHPQHFVFANGITTFTSMAYQSKNGKDQFIYNTPSSWDSSQFSVLWDNDENKYNYYGKDGRNYALLTGATGTPKVWKMLTSAAAKQMYCFEPQGLGNTYFACERTDFEMKWATALDAVLGGNHNSPPLVINDLVAVQNKDYMYLLNSNTGKIVKKFKGADDDLSDIEYNARTPLALSANQLSEQFGCMAYHEGNLIAQMGFRKLSNGKDGQEGRFLYTYSVPRSLDDIQQHLNNIHISKQPSVTYTILNSYTTATSNVKTWAEIKSILDANPTYILFSTVNANGSNPLNSEVNLVILNVSSAVLNGQHSGDALFSQVYKQNNVVRDRKSYAIEISSWWDIGGHGAHSGIFSQSNTNIVCAEQIPENEALTIYIAGTSVTSVSNVRFTNKVKTTSSNVPRFYEFNYGGPSFLGINKLGPVEVNIPGTSSKRIAHLPEMEESKTLSVYFGKDGIHSHTSGHKFAIKRIYGIKDIAGFVMVNDIAYGNDWVGINGLQRSYVTDIECNLELLNNKFTLLWSSMQNASENDADVPPLTLFAASSQYSQISANNMSSEADKFYDIGKFTVPADYIGMVVISYCDSPGHVSKNHISCLIVRK